MAYIEAKQRSLLWLLKMGQFLPFPFHSFIAFELPCSIIVYPGNSSLYRILFAKYLMQENLLQSQAIEDLVKTLFS